MVTTMLKIMPIKNDADHKKALAGLTAFMEKHANCAKGSPEGACMRAQALIIEDYEKKRWPMPAEWSEDFDAVDYLKTALKEKGITQSMVAECFGSQPRCSAVLNRKRGFTLNMARKLHRKLGVPAELLLR